MEISIDAAQRLLDESCGYGSWCLAAGGGTNWCHLDDAGRFLTFSDGQGQDETVWQIDLSDGATRHRGTGPADCYSDWEGGRRDDEEDEMEEDEK